MFIDATVRAQGAVLGIAFKNERGQLIGWWGKAARNMTINEAEYEALIFGLGMARDRGAQVVSVFSDSRVVVEQMTGIIRVNHDVLKRLHRRATDAARRFGRVTYTHIPRELNVLADAMAEEAVLQHRLRQVLQESGKLYCGSGTDDAGGLRLLARAKSAIRGAVSTDKGVVGCSLL